MVKEKYKSHFIQITERISFLPRLYLFCSNSALFHLVPSESAKCKRSKSSNLSSLSPIKCGRMYMFLFIFIMALKISYWNLRQLTLELAKCRALSIFLDLSTFQFEHNFYSLFGKFDADADVEWRNSHSVCTNCSCDALFVLLVSHTIT